MQDLGSFAVRYAGSSPAPRTNLFRIEKRTGFFPVLLPVNTRSGCAELPESEKNAKKSCFEFDYFSKGLYSVRK